MREVVCTNEHEGATTRDVTDLKIGFRWNKRRWTRISGLDTLERNYSKPKILECSDATQGIECDTVKGPGEDRVEDNQQRSPGQILEWVVLDRPANCLGAGNMAMTQCTRPSV